MELEHKTITIEVSSWTLIIIGAILFCSCAILSGHPLISIVEIGEPKKVETNK